MDLEHEYQYYYSQGGQQCGPVSTDEIIQLARNGKITKDTHLWREGMGNWIPASQINQLVPILNPPPLSASNRSAALVPPVPAHLNSQTSPSSPFLKDNPKPIGISNRVVSSKKAVWALVIGIASVVGSCFFHWAGGIAIILGVWAIVSIATSNGRLSGLPQSIIGVVLGLASVGLGFLFSGFEQEEKEKRHRYHVVVSGNGEIPLDLMSYAIEDVSDYISPYAEVRKLASGNSEEAKELALAFSHKLVESAVATLEAERGELPVDDGFLTYCQLNQDSCAILFHVPDLETYDHISKDLLADLGWVVANVMCENAGHVGKDLVVAMRGNQKFHRIDKGTVVEPPSKSRLKLMRIMRMYTENEERGLESSGRNEERLYPYFRNFRKSEVR